ncbi:MAG: hypothetical protein ABIH82_04350 [Candidatus Woesearchaeota archaeon]
MKKVILMLIFVFLLMVACSSNKEYVCSDGQVVSNPDFCQEEKAETTTIPTSSTPQTTTSSPSQESIPVDIKELISKSSKVKSMSYEYKNSPDRTDSIYSVLFKDNKMKIELPIFTKIQNQNEIDTVIIEMNSKTVRAYCESFSYCIEQGDRGEVDYSQYYKPTPLDLLENINSAEKVGEEIVFDRNTWKLKVNGNQFYWIDTFYGVPLKVDGNGEYHHYEKALFNQVRSIEFENKD